MLRITQQTSSQQAKSYYSSADYLSEGQEIVGNWGGEAARTLGLNGVVDKERFDRLCDNLDPRDGKQLTARNRSDRTVGYDFTFSVPKSVSVLYALSGDEDIRTAFRAAVDETMQDLETEMKTRVRRGGKDIDRTTGNMVWAEFIHTTSRPVDGIPDPQLHAHCFVFNSTWDNQERLWKAGQFRDLKRDAPYFQAGFRVRLANKLQELGFGVTRKRDDFEITGVPASVIKRFSRRTDLIEKQAAERGITDPDRKGELGAITREKKSHDLDWVELCEVWDKRLTNDERETLTTISRRETPLPRPPRSERLAVDYALEHCFTREAVVPERKLATEALKRGLGSVTVADVKRELYTRPLIRGEYDGRKMATTSGMVATEQRLIAMALQGRGKFRPLGDPERPISRTWLNAGQQKAVKYVLGSRDFVTLVRGVAGTGKTTLEQEIGEALAAAGKPVTALAQSAEASRGVLRMEAGFDQADTVARFLVDKKMQKQAQDGVILIDEASLLGSKDMLRVFETAEELKAQVVLVGDKRQHRSVSAGEPLALLEEKAGLPVAQVKEIMRQSGDYLKATKALSEGKVGEGFAELDKLGWIKEVPDADRYQQLATAYLTATAEKKRNGELKSALVVTPTHAEAAQITQAVRSALQSEGKLTGERSFATWVPAHLTDPEKADPTNYEAGDLVKFHQHAPGHKSGSRLVLAEGQQAPCAYADRFEVYRPSQLTLAAGDRVRVTASSKTKDGKHRLETGTLMTVKGFTRSGDLIVDHDWVIAKGGHLSYGYAVTSVASQGRTVDNILIGQSSDSWGASNHRQFYVSVSRGKSACQIFTDDKTELLRAVQRADQPISATAFAEGTRTKPTLRQRLRRHLAFVRRLPYANQTYPSHLTISQKEKTLQREASNER